MDEDNKLPVFFKRPAHIQKIAGMLLSGTRISKEDACVLWKEAELPFLAYLADSIRARKYGKNTFYNRNIHVEPTNLCIKKCRFCSYYRKEGEAGAWNTDIPEILVKLKEHPDITEIHITGGVHPDKDLKWYSELFLQIKKTFPQVHIKALTAEELHFIFLKARVNDEVGFRQLISSGLGSIPGGGAEIFSEEVRSRICPEKISGKRWLELHRMAHHSGLFSNATMLFGHIEKIEHRLDHMEQLRNLQDQTGKLNAFIPLVFKNRNNEMSDKDEASMTDILKTFSMARIFLDNIPHIKAYWPMLGKEKAILMQSFGADDLDGTIHDSTQIYTLAGAEEHRPSMSPAEIRQWISQSGYLPVERDSAYKII